LKNDIECLICKKTTKAVIIIRKLFKNDLKFEIEIIMQIYILKYVSKKVLCLSKMNVF